MKLQGEHGLAGPRQLVWEMIQDPDVLRHILPGIETLEQVGKDQYKAKIRIRIGPVSGVFSGHVELKNKVPPERYEMVVEGATGPSFGRGSAKVVLEDSGESQTQLTYDADLEVGGLLASVGQRLMESVGKTLIRQCFEALDREIAQRK